MYNRQQQGLATQAASTAQVDSVSPEQSPTNPDGAGSRAARLAERADAVIAHILSGDSRAFIDANVQTGGQ